MDTATQEKPRPFSVQLAPALRRQITERAQLEDRSLGQVVRLALRSYLADDSERAS